MKCCNTLCKDSKKPNISFNCKLCKAQRYCSKTCAIEDWNIGHSLVCELNRNKRLNKIETICPFIKQGQFLNSVEADKLAPKVNIHSQYEEVKKVGRLGRGSYGEVVLMRDKTNDDYAAVKIIKKKEIRDERERAAFYNEITIQKRIVHENIVRLLCHAEDDENIYIVMECIKKGSLFYLLRKKGFFTEREAFFFFTQACSAVYFLHKNNIMHRDIKPENLLIADNGLLKLCDFGCCAKDDDRPRSNYCGTVEYMAPEIIRNKVCNKKADIWSLGVLLYEMLKGYVPYYGKKQGEASFCKPRCMNMKEDVKMLIESMLSPDPEERPEVWEIFLHPWVKRMQHEFGITEIKTRKEEETVLERHKTPDVRLVKKNDKVASNRVNVMPISKTLLYRRKSGVGAIRKQDSNGLPILESKLDGSFNLLNPTKYFEERKRIELKVKIDNVRKQEVVSLNNIKNECIKLSLENKGFSPVLEKEIDATKYLAIDKRQDLRILKKNYDSSSTIDKAMIEREINTLTDALGELKEEEISEGTTSTLKNSNYIGSTKRMRQRFIVKHKKKFNTCKVY